MKMDQILEQVDGAIGIADDVVGYAKSEKEHDKILHRLMQIAAENGLVFNSTKCKIKSKSISFFGMIYSENGVSPDLEKLKDLQNMPYQTCKKELQEYASKSLTDAEKRYAYIERELLVILFGV